MRLVARLGLIAALLSAIVFAAGTRQERHPVSGRVIAPTMGVQGAPWLDRAERESEEHPTRAVEALRLKAGMVVADVGAGSGYLIEFRGEDASVPILPAHKMTVVQIRQELAADGLVIERVLDVLPWQHIVILKAGT